MVEMTIKALAVMMIWLALAGYAKAECEGMDALQAAHLVLLDRFYDQNTLLAEQRKLLQKQQTLLNILTNRPSTTDKITTLKQWQ